MKITPKPIPINGLFVFFALIKASPGFSGGTLTDISDP
jgi:hypothetical protein